jgi:hypothetical protein
VTTLRRNAKGYPIIPQQRVVGAGFVEQLHAECCRRKTSFIAVVVLECGHHIYFRDYRGEKRKQCYQCSYEQAVAAGVLPDDPDDHQLPLKRSWKWGAMKPEAEPA